MGQTIDQAPEPVLTVAEVSRRYNVSTRTITRWRGQGLVARRFLDRRPVQGGLPRVEPGPKFVEAHRDQVDRGALGSIASATRSARRSSAAPDGWRPVGQGWSGRDCAEDRPEDGTLDRDRPHDLKNLRPANIPIARSSSPTTPPARRHRPSPDCPPLQSRARGLGRGSRRPVRPYPVEHLPGHQRGPDAQRLQGDQAGIHAPSQLRGPLRPRKPRSSGPMPEPPDGKPPRKTKAPKGLAPLPGQSLRGQPPGPESRRRTCSAR